MFIAGEHAAVVAGGRTRGAHKEKKLENWLARSMAPNTRLTGNSCASCSLVMVSDRPNTACQSAGLGSMPKQQLSQSWRRSATPIFDAWSLGRLVGFLVPRRSRLLHSPHLIAPRRPREDPARLTTACNFAECALVGGRHCFKSILQDPEASASSSLQAPHGHCAPRYAL